MTGARRGVNTGGSAGTMGEGALHVTVRRGGGSSTTGAVAGAAAFGAGAGGATGREGDEKRAGKACSREGMAMKGRRGAGQRRVWLTDVKSLHTGRFTRGKFRLKEAIVLSGLDEQKRTMSRLTRRVTRREARQSDRTV